MSTEHDDGGQAFPQMSWEYDGQNNVLQFQFPGMTLRDYFAAKMAAALLISCQNDPAGVQSAVRKSGARDAQEWVATTAFSMADELLKARKS